MLEHNVTRRLFQRKFDMRGSQLVEYCQGKSCGHHFDTRGMQFVERVKESFVTVDS